jgi:hypothetical protein
MGGQWKERLKESVSQYDDSFVRRRKPFGKSYEEMTRLEQRIYNKIHLTAWLSTLAGILVGLVLILIYRLIAG